MAREVLVRAPRALGDGLELLSIGRPILSRSFVSASQPQRQHFEQHSPEMMRGVLQHGLQMAQTGSLGNEKPHSAVTSLIDILTLPKYAEDDLEGITELVEVINLQTTGPTEASRAIRKKLKYSPVHSQLRALTILKLLVENCGQKFQTTFANERLVDRIKLMAVDPVTDPKVKKKIMTVLASWYVQFKDDPSMRLVAGLYSACGGGAKSTAGSRSAAHDTYDAKQAQYEREAKERAERKAEERARRVAMEEAERSRIAKLKEDKLKAKTAKNKPAPGAKRPKFVFEQEKPKIMQSVATGTQSAQALINALQHVNREKESVTTNARVQEALEKVKQDRKIVIRYVQLVASVEGDPDGSFVATLLATNEQALTALALYDRMSKPIDLDSEDEDVEEVRKAAMKQGLTVPPADNDAMSIRSRLSAFELQDREVDKLQERQRARVERAKRAQTHPDLLDINFGASSSRAPADEDEYQHGLSDYSDSDYLSSDGELPPPSRGAPPTSASSSKTTDLPGSNAKAYAQYVNDAAGQRGLLEEGEEEEDDDPFGDNHAGPSTPGLGERAEWREI